MAEVDAATGRPQQSKDKQRQHFLPTPVLTALLIVGGIITTGTIVSLIFNTSLHTSAMTAAVPPHRDFWFANKSNPINQYFVKLGWAWTTLFFVFHLTTSSTSLPNSSSIATQSTRRALLIRRISKFAIATLIWIAFQFWFNSRVFLLSGGTCALELPTSLVDQEDKWLSLPGIGAQQIIHKGGNGQMEPESAWLPISNSFCDHRRPISSISNPALRDALESIISHGGEGENKQFLIPSFRGGIDISGHVFLLTMSTALIFDDLAPTIRLMMRDGWRAVVDGRGSVAAKGARLIVKAVGLALLALWCWMLLVTSIFFHSPTEKFSGFIVGVLGAYTFKLLPSLFVPYIERKLAALQRSVRGQ